MLQCRMMLLEARRRLATPGFFPGIAERIAAVVRDLDAIAGQMAWERICRANAGGRVEEVSDGTDSFIAATPTHAAARELELLAEAGA